MGIRNQLNDIDNGFAMVVSSKNMYLNKLSDVAMDARPWTLGVGYEFEQRPVELRRVLPDAGVTALGRPPLRPRDPLVQALRQAQRDQDVLLAREHERRRRDLAQPIGAVVRADRAELREVGVE